MRRLMVFICAVGAFASAAPRPPAETSRITQEELVRRTQELFDAVAGGNQGPWKKYLADDWGYFAEKGRNMDKAPLLKDLTPLPNGDSGSVRSGPPLNRGAGQKGISMYAMCRDGT